MSSATLPPPVLKTTSFPDDWSLADLLKHLGDIPAERVRLLPRPGTATVDDVDWINDHEDRLFELIDGVLVEKAMGWKESDFALSVGSEIRQYLKARKLGKVLGADGTLQFFPGQVRIPDACFISWERIEAADDPDQPIPLMIPELVVEVLSQSNTRKEMGRKLREYFAAGVQLVWYIDPKKRSAQVFTSPDKFTTLDSTGVLDGGTILPGFRLPLADVFAGSEPPRGKSRKRR